MKNIAKILALIVFFGFITSTLYAYDSKDEEIKELKKQLMLIQKRLEQLEKEQKAQKQESEKVKKYVGTIYKKTGGIVEKLNKIKLSASADLYSTYYNVSQDVDKGATKTEDTFTNLLDLKFSAQPTDEIQFHTTLTMYKLWGAWNDAYSTVAASDYDVTATPSDSSVRVKRAYVDYRPKFLNQLVNLEFGRLPTSGGYLTKYRYNRPSQMSYPDLAFNGNTDGVALTFYPGKYIPYFDTFTLVYAKSKYDRDSAPFLSDDLDLSDVDFYVAQADFSIPYLKNAKLSALWIRTNNLRVPLSSSQRSQLEASLKQGIEQNSNNTLTLNSVSYPEYYGYYDKLVFQFDAERILNTPFDVFASFGYSWTNPNGKTITYTMKTNTNPATVIPGDNVLTHNSIYLVTPNNKEEKEGRAIYVGLRYNIDIEKLNNPKIGFEYNYGSKYWIGMDVAGLDPFKKLNIRGHVYEGYWIQPFVENKIQLRTGYQYIDRDYTDSLFGGVYGVPKKVDEIDKVFYLSLDFSL